ncbi:MAG: adenylate/guanylate cyclase domain-containing protein [Planctomycetes bacterium]|nr:adenylate/guanylate cyclase domain-containing protein [Planctomycetota bacterium]
MAPRNTVDVSVRSAGSTLVRARELLRKAKLDFGQAHEFKTRLKLGVTVSLAVMLALSVLLVGGDSALIEYAEKPTQNMRVRTFESNAKKDPDILIVNIDEEALVYGDLPPFLGAKAEDAGNRYAWPWPRHVYNKILRYCREGGARVVVFDLIFYSSGPNTNQPKRLAPVMGRKLKIDTFDAAGDDLFVMEATAREDVALALTLSASARDKDVRDTFAPRYSTLLNAPDAYRDQLVTRFGHMRAGMLPFPGLLDGTPDGMRGSRGTPDAERMEQFEGYRNAVNADLTLNETPRLMSLLPIAPREKLTGVGALGVVNGVAEIDGTLRSLDVCAPLEGQIHAALPLEAYRLWVLSWAREALAQPTRRADFARRFPGLAVDDAGLHADGRVYDLSQSLRNAPINIEVGTARYLGASAPLDSSGRMQLRFRNFIDYHEMPSYKVDPGTYSQRGGAERPFATYPSVSAKDILLDYDFIDQNRRIEAAEANVRKLEGELAAATDDKKADAQKALKAAQDWRTKLAPRPGKVAHGDPANLVKDKIVIVAGSAEGLYDRHKTPLDPETPGTWVLATALDNLKQGDFMHEQPRWQVWAAAWLAAAIAVFLVLLLPKLRHSVPAILALALVAVVAACGMFALQQWFAVAAPLAGLFAGLTGGAAAKALTEGRQRAQREAFARQYMGNELVAHVIKQPGALKLGGQNREMTIYFSDVAGFTTLTETLGPENPERLVEVLNIYLERMTDLMMSSGAVIDKYIGDAIMCFWGAPRDLADHAVRACQGALMCKREMERMQPLFADAVRGVAPQLISPDGHVLSARAGINSGIVTVGNMGSSKRFAYTVMGDAVNLASRLEGQNKEYGSWIMLGENTEKLVRGQFTVRRLDLMVVKGKTKPTQVFELLGEAVVPDFIAQLVEYWETGIEAFRERDFERALQAFKLALPLETDKDDFNPSRLYIERCKAYLEVPPPPDWNGVYVKKSK